MKLLLASLVLASITLTVQVSTAEACSPADDQLYPDSVPETKPFDPSLSLEAPEVLEAIFYHSDDSASSACGNATCGAISGLQLTIAAPSDADAIVRVRDALGNETFASGQPSSDPEVGMVWRLSLYGFDGEGAAEMDLVVELVTADGYLSEKTVTSAYREAETGGCSTGGSIPGASTVLWLAALFLPLRRRRQHS